MKIYSCDNGYPTCMKAEAGGKFCEYFCKVHADEFKAGDLVKIIDQNKVFEVKSISQELPYLPAGFLIDKDGHFINPKFCKKYNGATSVLTPTPPTER